MFRLATISSACLLGLLSLGASAVRQPTTRPEIKIEVCKKSPGGSTCGPSKDFPLPRVGHVGARNPRIDCPQRCEAQVSVGLRLKLTATESLGYKFAGWSGLCKGEPDVCEVTIPGSPRVLTTKAFFSLKTTSPG
jgi:hypothetical protein